MKKHLITSLFFLLITLAAPAQIMLKLVNEELVAYSYAGGDEFNSSSLNENYWTNGLGWTRVLMSQDLAFSPKNVKIENGLALFIANKEDSTYILGPWEVDSGMLKKQKLVLEENKFRTAYAAGCIISKQKYHYGLYELRFKVEEGRGVWPAFWFFGGNKNEEIDAFELKGEINHKIHVDTHCPYGCDRGYKNSLGFKTNWGAWMPVSHYLHEGFNTLLLEWRKEDIIWYINGYPLAYFKGSFPNPMNVYLNTSVAKDGGAFKPGPDKSTVWPNTYSVDYLRMWQPLDSLQTLILKSNEAVSAPILPEPSVASEPVKKRGLMYRKKELNPVEGMICISVSSGNKLNVQLYGKLKKTRPDISLTSKNSGKTILLKATEKGLEAELDLLKDKELDLLIVSDGKKYSRRITLN